MIYGAMVSLNQQSFEALRLSVVSTKSAASADEMDNMISVWDDAEAAELVESSPLLSNCSWTPTTSRTSLASSSCYPLNNTIRFQVVLWHAEKLDVVNQQIAVTFRVTIFWNDTSDQIHGTEVTDSSNKVWHMHGRQKAFLHEYPHTLLQAVEVPPVSILNGINFTTIGNPEVAMMRDSEKLMRWTCMYRATLIQDHWRVDDFPHDEHDITLKLGILSHRCPGSQWDRNKWKLGLATAADTDGTTRVPHGLVVDHVSIPEFQYRKYEGLSFSLAPLNYGHPDNSCQDQSLEIKLRVWRDSNYYDKNIMPLLAVLHFVATSILCLEAQIFFYRGLLTLNMAFVGMGLRITTDRHLPSSSYQIKIQRIFNEYFFGTLALVLESLAVYLLQKHGFEYTGYIDVVAGLMALTQNANILMTYYAAAQKHNRKGMRFSLKER